MHAPKHKCTLPLLRIYANRHHQLSNYWSYFIRSICNNKLTYFAYKMHLSNVNCKLTTCYSSLMVEYQTPISFIIANTYIINLEFQMVVIRPMTCAILWSVNIITFACQCANFIVQFFSAINDLSSWKSRTIKRRVWEDEKEKESNH